MSKEPACCTPGTTMLGRHDTALDVSAHDVALRATAADMCPLSINTMMQHQPMRCYLANPAAAMHNAQQLSTSLQETPRENGTANSKPMLTRTADIYAVQAQQLYCLSYACAATAALQAM